MRTIVVTGANGQLGQHLIKFLQDTAPYLRIVATTRHKSCDPQVNFIFDSRRVIFETLELNDVYSINSLIIKFTPDYFVNFAANSFASTSWTAPAETMTNNALAVLSQLEAIKSLCPCCKYLNCGSSEEFSSDPDNLIDEDTPLAPRNPYGISKAAARHLVRAYRARYHLFAVQPWLFNSESELRGPEFISRKVTLGAAMAACQHRTGQAITPFSFGDGNAIRSWQFAGDAVRAIWVMLQLPEPRDYVISGLSYHSVFELIETAAEEAGISGKFDLNNRFVTSFGEVLARPDGLPARPNSAQRLVGNSQRLIADTGFKPELSFRELISRMVKHDISLLA